MTEVTLEQLSTVSPSDVFETYMVPAIFAPLAEALLDLTHLQPGDRLLDVACGTGVVARSAFKRVGSRADVVGLDFNAGQLEVARKLEPAIEWREGDATNLPFSDDQFDVVTCQQGLQFLPDRQVAASEMYRVLAPGGRLAAAVWCSMSDFPTYAALSHALSRHVGTQGTSMIEAIFSLPDEGQLRRLLQDAGFQNASVQRHTITANFQSAQEFVAVMMRGSNLARGGLRVEDETVKVLQAEVAEALKSFEDASGLGFPMAANVASARK